jgi:lysophospholipase L1-like esterase
MNGGDRHRVKRVRVAILRRGRALEGGLATLAAVLVAGLAPGGASAAPESEDPVALKRGSIPRCPAREVAVEPGEARWVSLRCRGLNRANARIVGEPLHGDLESVDQKRDRVRYRPDDGYDGRDHFVVERVDDRDSYRASVRLEIGEVGDLDCNDQHAIARFNGAVEVQIRCQGAGLERLKLVREPVAGEVDNVRLDSPEGGVETLTARFVPDPGFSGQDTIVVDASADGESTYGSIGVSVLPWRLRAMGDSVTAGFGFRGDGTPVPTFFQVASGCRPPNNLNNRCSSNSNNGPNEGGPPGWSKNFGLANNISWAAQFANKLRPGGEPITAPDGFQNLAVTGSAPTDWLPGGPFSSQLKGIIAEDPEIVAMTLGANPLLSTILFTSTGASCASKQTADELRECIRPLFQEVDLNGNLQRVYTALLDGTDDSTVIVFEYDLSDPWLTNFKNWQVETMIDFFNAQITTAVANTKQALPGKASRLIEIEAQVEPGAPRPDQLPRFNIGVPPVSQQTWTATHDCGTGHLVDGPSHQSTDTQNSIKGTPGFCPGDPWVITTDGGIHPNAAGYAQYANTLAHVAEQNGLLPPSS